MKTYISTLIVLIVVLVGINHCVKNNTTKNHPKAKQIHQQSLNHPKAKQIHQQSLPDVSRMTKDPYKLAAMLRDGNKKKNLKILEKMYNISSKSGVSNAWIDESVIGDIEYSIRDLYSLPIEYSNIRDVLKAHWCQLVFDILLKYQKDSSNYYPNAHAFRLWSDLYYLTAGRSTTQLDNICKNILKEMLKIVKNEHFSWGNISKIEYIKEILFLEKSYYSGSDWLEFWDELENEVTIAEKEHTKDIQEMEEHYRVEFQVIQERETKARTTKVKPDSSGVKPDSLKK